MIRLFVRFSLVTLGAAFASFVLMMIFYGSAQDAFFKPRAALEMNSLAALLQDQLRGVPVEKVQLELDKMAETSGFRGRMIRADEWTESQRDGMFVKFKDTPYLIEVTTNETVAADMKALEGTALLAALGRDDWAVGGGRGCFWRCRWFASCALRRRPCCGSPTET